MNVFSRRCCAEGKACKEANCSCYRVELSCTIYCLCTAGDVCRNSFTKKEDEEQHNYDHGHDNYRGEHDEEKDEQLNG